MKQIAITILIAISCAACNSNNQTDADHLVHSTPIDSTNVDGTAPATYAPDNPRNDSASKANMNDTGTNANNVHNAGGNQN